MEYKDFKKKAMLSGIATGLVYSAVAGKGPFNKIRFREQHAELDKYVSTNYPNCQYSPIVKHGRGWSSKVMQYGRLQTFVYFTKSDDGVYVFTEAKEKIK